MLAIAIILALNLALVLVGAGVGLELLLRRQSQELERLRRERLVMAQMIYDERQLLLTRIQDPQLGTQIATEQGAPQQGTPKPIDLSESVEPTMMESQMLDQRAEIEEAVKRAEQELADRGIPVDVLSR